MTVIRTTQAKYLRVQSDLRSLLEEKRVQSSPAARHLALIGSITRQIVFRAHYFDDGILAFAVLQEVCTRCVYRSKERTGGVSLAEFSVA